ncbi:hypothetical protein GC170_02165 [bacterium]|nr:hypothetical protein [bacterium]
MKQRMAHTRALAAGAMIFGLGVSGAMAFPDDKAKEQGGDLSAILEKLPPEVREKLLAEIERLRDEAEKLKVDSLERAERLKSDAAKKIEEMKRDAQERLEQVEVQLRSKAESAEAIAKEQILKARAQAELARSQAQEAAAKARAEAEKLHADHAGKHHAEGDHVAKKSVTEERTVIVRGVPSGDGKNGEVQEMRVEIVKEDGQDKPVVRIFKDGKEVKADQLPGGLVIEEEMPKVDVLREAANLEKLPPEKRAELEKAREELKTAQEKLRIAAEKLAKLQGGKQGNVMIFRGQPGVPVEIRPFMGDRVPGVPLPPGAVGRADRLPRPPLPPMVPQPPASPELEKRISKAEQALDDILLELKKLQDNKKDGEDDDDDEEEKEEKGEKKPGREKNDRRRDSGDKAREERKI